MILHATLHTCIKLVFLIYNYTCIPQASLLQFACENLEVKCNAHLQLVYSTRAAKKQFEACLLLAPVTMPVPKIRPHPCQACEQSRRPQAHTPNLQPAAPTSSISPTKVMAPIFGLTSTLRYFLNLESLVIRKGGCRTVDKIYLRLGMSRTTFPSSISRCLCVKLADCCWYCD
jgi:hypothetical protein